MRVPIPAGAFYALKNTPQGFSSSQNAVFAKEAYAFRSDPNICWDLRVPIPAGAFYAPPPSKNMAQGVFVQLKCCLGGTGYRSRGNRRPLTGEPAARPAPTDSFRESKNPKGKPGWGMKTAES